MNEINKRKILPVITGILTIFTDFYIVPVFFMRSVDDLIWMSLMALFPAAICLWLMYFTEKCPPKAVFLSLLTEIAIIIIFYKPIGTFLGYKLTSLQWDLIGFIQYFMFTFGCILAATTVQFLSLWIAWKVKK